MCCIFGAMVMAIVMAVQRFVKIRILHRQEAHPETWTLTAAARTSNSGRPYTVASPLDDGRSPTQSTVKQADVTLV